MSSESLVDITLNPKRIGISADEGRVYVELIDVYACEIIRELGVEHVVSYLLDEMPASELIKLIKKKAG